MWVMGKLETISVWIQLQLISKTSTWGLRQVKKFGDSSRIKLIAKEAGGAVAGTTSSAQKQLWKTLVNGCNEAVHMAGPDSKVTLLRP